MSREDRVELAAWAMVGALGFTSHRRVIHYHYDEETARAVLARFREIVETASADTEGVADS